ncbi:C-X-C motif chemokine 11-6-like isoform X8 [Anguilla anguilla]|uniref:C-X-C motif chemokine 11-6-like isoform X8 n=1 Tax=Anguilla anguilla TaxID=7936 RepID=UPI0015B27591|nr:C-X-C motif chemokine 11-6-like isoform X8 [Anguilla anguilla]
MRSAAFILLACLLLVDVKGMETSLRGRCQCMDTGMNFIKPKLIEKVEVLSPSLSCQHLEIIATLKASGEQKCLNPKSRFAKNFIKDEQKKKGNLE